jgi:hypothetical protein
MFQLWTASKLNKLPFSLQREIYFYAPLVDSLDFYGTDPVTYSRAGTTTAAHRSGTFTIAANVPPFEYDGENQLGLYLNAPAALSFSAQNNLDDANTLIWFEDGVPKSTPTDSNPFSFTGAWAGNLDIHLKHVVKAKRQLTAAEIVKIQTAMADVAQVITPPPPTVELEGFVFHTPSGTRNGSNVTFTLPSDVDISQPSFGMCFGGAIVRVAAAPGEFEYTLSGTGNRTVTMGLGPTTDYPFQIGYFEA